MVVNHINLGRKARRYCLKLRDFCFVFALFYCGIASGQSLMVAEIGRVPDSISVVESSAPNGDNSDAGAQQRASQAAAKPGVVMGTVTDNSGSVAEGAVVTLTSQDKSFSKQVASGANGEFSFSNVPPGRFKLSVRAAGFSNQEFSGVLAPGQTFLSPPLVISVATVVTDVKVSGDPVEVATEEVKIELQQRVLGVFPNFYVTYEPDPAPLTTKLKFQLAWRSSIDPVTIAGTAFLAGLEQAGDQYPEFGQGAEGYGKRLGAGYADVLGSTFLSGAIFPVLFKQDPRYYYRGTGSTRSRLLHAVGNSVWCRSDSGKWEVNYSNIAGVFGGAALASTFYPTNSPGMFTLSNGFIRMGESSLGGVIQEFVLRKLTKAKRHGDDGAADLVATPSNSVAPAKKP